MKEGSINLENLNSEEIKLAIRDAASKSDGIVSDGLQSQQVLFTTIILNNFHIFFAKMANIVDKFKEAEEYLDIQIVKETYKDAEEINKIYETLDKINNQFGDIYIETIDETCAIKPYMKIYKNMLDTPKYNRTLALQALRQYIGMYEYINENLIPFKASLKRLMERIKFLRS